MILFQINDPNVSAELFDNEVLAINLSSGHYYSMRLSAVPFWLLISNGHTLDYAVAEISKCYDVEESIVKDDFVTLLDQLIQSQLIKERNPELAPLPAEYKESCTGKYEKPAFENYTDMKDLILLDPIHEVDVIGWPNKLKLNDEK